MPEPMILSPDVQERIARLLEHRFRYLERTGTGLPLVFLHGLGDCADQFGPVAGRLPEPWRLLALDQRGHGGSWKPERGYSPEDFAEDARRFLDALGLESAHLFGHSMGGRNALLLAAARPGRVRSLIVGDIGPERNLDDVEATRAFFNSLPATFASGSEARAHLRARKPGYTDEMLDILMKDVEPAPGGGVRWRFSSSACIQAVTEARTRQWWDRLSLVGCPVLLLHAEESRELSDEVAERMMREIPDGRTVRVPASGHNFHLENPAFAAARIRAFVEEVEARRRGGPAAGSSGLRSAP